MAERMEKPFAHFMILHKFPLFPLLNWMKSLKQNGVEKRERKKRYQDQNVYSISNVSMENCR